MAQIYLVQNSVNGKLYLGQTKRTAAKRWEEHVKQAQSKSRDCPALYNAIRKYGCDAFSVSTLCELSDTDLDEAEKFLIGVFGARFGYNVDGGGRGRSRYKHSPESRKRMSESRKALWADKEYRDRMSKAHIGQKAWNKGLPSKQSKEFFSKIAKGGNGWRIREARKRGFM